LGTSTKHPKPNHGQSPGKNLDGKKGTGSQPGGAAQPASKANTSATRPLSKTTTGPASATVMNKAKPATEKAASTKQPPNKRELKNAARREEISRKIEERRQQRERERRQRTLKRWGIIGGPSLLIIVVVGLIIYNALFGPSVAAYLKGTTIDGIPCDQGEHSQTHYHAHLAIYINGKPYAIPGNIGRQSATGCYYWLHVHDDAGDDGVIHVEAPADGTYTLHQFFDIWGQPLSTTNLLGHKVDATHKMTVYVYSLSQSQIDQQNQVIQDAESQGQSPAPFTVTPPSDLKPYTGDPAKIQIKPYELIVFEYGSPLVSPQPWTFESGE
jgi:hypothetical protein